MSTFLDLLSECPENKTLKSACTLTIAILIFLHVPFWLLRDLCWTSSVVLTTKHFSAQSICFSSVSPETPFASPLPYFAFRSSRGLGTKAEGPSSLLGKLLHRNPGSYMLKNIQETHSYILNGQQWWLHAFIQIYAPAPCHFKDNLSRLGVDRGVERRQTTTNYPQTNLME